MNTKFRIVNEYEDIIVNEPDALVIKKEGDYFCIDAIKNGKTFVMSRYNTYEDAKEIYDAIAQMIASKVEGYENFKVISQEKKDETVRIADKISKGVVDEETINMHKKLISTLHEIMNNICDEDDEDD